MLHGKSLHLEANTPEETIVAMLKALASLPRWRILQYLSEGGRTVTDVARALDMPSSTAAAQIKILEEARFIHTELQAATHGLEKVCTRTYDNLTLQLPYLSGQQNSARDVWMPVGAYTSFDVNPTCGLATESSVIGYLDDPLSFYEPDRVAAGLIWFRSGYLEYTFPNRLPPNAPAAAIVVSMEICSEAPLHNLSWPSDVTLAINGIEVGTWTCPADFGGQRGRLTPSWWDSKDSQYGVLKRWLVNEEGAFIDGHPLSTVSIRRLNIERDKVITLRIGVNPNADHVGGLNLFGASFGNYPQDLSLRVEHVRTPAKSEPRHAVAHS